jgi:hypothetical protein
LHIRGHSAGEESSLLFSGRMLHIDENSAGENSLLTYLLFSGRMLHIDEYGEGGEQPPVFREDAAYEM